MMISNKTQPTTYRSFSVNSTSPTSCITFNPPNHFKTTLLESKPNPLSTRFGQTETVVDKEVYFVGGFATEEFLDIRILNCETLKCKLIKPENGPNHRWGHSACLVKNRYIFGFGGFNQNIQYE